MPAELTRWMGNADKIVFSDIGAMQVVAKRRPASSGWAPSYCMPRAGAKKGNRETGTEFTG